MRRHPAHRFLLLTAALLCLVGGGMAACTSDSPSEPQQQPAPTPPGTAPPTGDFIITVTANPAELPAGGDDPSLITVQVRRRSDNQPPPNGTTVLLSTTLGSFGSPGSGQQSGFAELVNGLAQIQLFPGPVEGLAVVQAQLENSAGQASVRIVGAATFFLSHVEPGSGTPQGGQQVTIVGGGFQEPVRVTFAGVVAQVVSVASNRIRVITPPSTQAVPPGATLPVTVSVVINLNEEDQATDTLPSGFVYALGGGNPIQPQVFGVNPASGVNEGGTQVSINGDGFEAPVQVFFGQGTAGSPNFNGVEATVVSVSRNQIVVITPSATGFGQDNRNQLVDLLVRNVNSGFFTVAEGRFRYGSSIFITAVSPGQILFDSQDRLTIFGQGFEAPVQVFVSGIEATVISVTGTEIVARAPIPLISDCTPVTGPVQVININSGDSDSTNSGDGPVIPDFLFRVPAPTITGVSPPSGTGLGGTTVTVSGTGFDPPVRVLFGDTAGSVVSVNAAGTAITVLTPPFSDFDEEACDDDADGQQGSRFVPTAVDVTVTNQLTDCEDVLIGGFTYNPTDTSCRGDAGPPPPPPPPQCNDGLDNDGDGFSDHASVNPINPDPECAGPNDDDESM